MRLDVLLKAQQNWLVPVIAIPLPLTKLVYVWACEAILARHMTSSLLGVFQQKFLLADNNRPMGENYSSSSTWWYSILYYFVVRRDKPQSMNQHAEDDRMKNRKTSVFNDTIKINTLCIPRRHSVGHAAGLSVLFVLISSMPCNVLNIMLSF